MSASSNIFILTFLFRTLRPLKRRTALDNISSDISGVSEDMYIYMYCQLLLKY
jgi:hypothetical protein